MQPETAPLRGWLTSVGSGGKAHFYGETGKTLCAEKKGIWPGGTTLGDLFTRPTRTTSDDHVCFYCAQQQPRVCECWSCRTKRAGGLR